MLTSRNAGFVDKQVAKFGYKERILLKKEMVDMDFTFSFGNEIYIFL